MTNAKDIINNKNQEFQDVIEHLRTELKSLRTGRASSAFVEMILVEAYGVKQHIRDLAQINIPESRQIVIQPWDKNVLKDIEKAIIASPLGVNPINEGTQLRISLPALTEDRRKELVKSVNQYGESARISVRTIRESTMKELKKDDEAGLISEDQRFRAEEDLQKRVDEINKVIKEIIEDKEKEVMTV